MGSIHRGGCIIHPRNQEGAGGKKGGGAGVCALCLKERLEALQSVTQELEEQEEEEGEEELQSSNSNPGAFNHLNYRTYCTLESAPPDDAFTTLDGSAAPPHHRILSRSPIFDDRLPSSAVPAPHPRLSFVPPRSSFTSTTSCPSGSSSPIRHHLRHHNLLFPPHATPAAADPSVGAHHYAPAADYSSSRSKSNVNPRDHPCHYNYNRGSAATTSPSASPSHYAFVHSKDAARVHAHRRNSTTYIHRIASLFHRSKKHKHSQHMNAQQCCMSKADEFMQKLPEFNILPARASVDSGGCNSVIPARASVDVALPCRLSSASAARMSNATAAGRAAAVAAMEMAKCDGNRWSTMANYDYNCNSAAAGCAEALSDARVMASRNANVHVQRKMVKNENQMVLQNSKKKIEMVHESSCVDQQGEGEEYNTYYRRGGGDCDGGGGAAAPIWPATPVAERLQRSKSSSAHVRRFDLASEPEQIVKLHAMARFDSWLSTPFRLIISRRQHASSVNCKRL